MGLLMAVLLFGSCLRFLGTGEVQSSLLKYIEAMTCDFQQCGILTSVDSDEPVQPHFKLRSSK